MSMPAVRPAVLNLLLATPLGVTEPNWKAHSALNHAFLTDKKFWPKKTVAELKPILAKYL